MDGVEDGRTLLVAGRPLELEMDRDVSVGAYAASATTGERELLTNVADPRTVVVLPAFLKNRGNPLALLIRGLHGPDVAELTYRAEASVDNRVRGVRPLDGSCVPALPIAILRRELTDERRPSWETDIESRKGADNYGFDLETLRIVDSPDGIPEIELTAGATADEGREANLAVLGLGNELRGSLVAGQIAKDWMQPTWSGPVASCLRIARRLKPPSSIRCRPTNSTRSTPCAARRALCCCIRKREPADRFRVFGASGSWRDGSWRFGVTVPDRRNSSCSRRCGDADRVDNARRNFRRRIGRLPRGGGLERSSEQIRLPLGTVPLTASPGLVKSEPGEPQTRRITHRVEPMENSSMIAETSGTSRTGLDSRQSFQELKTRLHRQVVDSIDLSKAGELPEAKLRQQLQALSQHICSLQQLNLAPRDRDAMVQEIMNEIYGFGPLQALMDDPEISDVLVNGSQNVHIERSGLLMPTDVKFANDQHLLEFIQRLVGRAGRRIDEVSPMVDCKLPDGSRLNAVIPRWRYGDRHSAFGDSKPRRCCSTIWFESAASPPRWPSS